MANNVNNGITGVIDIPGALRSRGAADGNLVGGVVAYAGDIYDTTEGKNQAAINHDLAYAVNTIGEDYVTSYDIGTLTHGSETWRLSMNSYFLPNSENVDFSAEYGMGGVFERYLTGVHGNLYVDGIGGYTGTTGGNMHNVGVHPLLYVITDIDTRLGALETNLVTIATTGSFNDLVDNPFDITNTSSGHYIKIGVDPSDNKPWSLAVGAESRSLSASNSIALGHGCSSDANQVVVGRYNLAASGPFIVGCGTSDSWKNGLVVGTDGKVYIYGVNGYQGNYYVGSPYPDYSLTTFVNNLDTRLTTLEGATSSSSSAPTYSAGTGVSISNNTISVDSSTYKVKDVQDGNGDSLVSNGIASVTASNIYDSDFSYLVYNASSRRYEDWYEYNWGEQQPYDQSFINSLLLSKYPNDSFIKLPNQACGCAISDYDVATGQNSLSNQQSSIGDFGSEYTNSFELSDYVPLGSIVRDDSGTLFNIKECSVYNQNSLCLLDGFVSNLNTATVYGNAYGKYSHVEGGRNSSFGTWSHAEGYGNSSIGEGSHAEGRYTVAVGEGSHAEGKLSGIPGYGTIDSFTEDGNYIILAVTGPVGTSGDFIYIPTFTYKGLIEIIDNLSSSNKIKIAKPNADNTLDFNKLVGLKYLIWDGGQLSGAIGVYSHTEGFDTSAIGPYSHAEGYCTITNNNGEHASGKYNKSNKVVYNNGSIVTNGTLFSIGVGINDTDRENAFEVLTNGQVYIKGIGDYDGTNSTDLGVKSVQQVIEELTLQIAALTNN